MPELNRELFEELYRLYVEAHNRTGVDFTEEERLQTELTKRLMEIYSANPWPFPRTYDDFRQAMIDLFIERNQKEDPRYRRPRF
jgi:hypothetical protein